MNPYIANPADIPSTDRYADVPSYGRYHPHKDDFRPNPAHINSHSSESLHYWASVLILCNESIRIYPTDEGGRDVFALGSVIVKSSHLHELKDGKLMEIDYSFADQNEIAAIERAKKALGGILVPKIYFSGKINGRQVLIQERLPGSALAVAWPYLSEHQRSSFKEQAREILQMLHAIGTPKNQTSPSHIISDPNILTNGRLNPVEADILFTRNHDSADLGFMHNDVTESNIIVDKDRIVGLIDWEMAGFWGWEVAAEVHRKIRTPQREHFLNAGLTEEQLKEIMAWKDLYDVGSSVSNHAHEA